MKVLNALAFVITLLVGVVAWGLYTFEPGLLIGTPWGLVHLSLVMAGAFLLGAAVVAMYVLAGWATYQSVLSRRMRELRQAKNELEALKKQYPQEMPVIPDRQQP